MPEYQRWRQGRQPFSGVWVQNHTIDASEESEGTYEDGVKDGLHIEWRKNGQKESEVTYRDGMVHGLEIQWRKNGQKEYEGTMKDGELVSARYWNSKGEEVETIEESFN